MTAYTLRTARLDEIDLLVDIDDDSAQLYAEAGLVIKLAADDPFVLAERELWLSALRAGQVFIAESATGEAMGFAALGLLDGQPYLDQLSVRLAFMRRGLGSALLARVFELAPAVLWLTTYAHLPFNRPYYERVGFRAVPDESCGPEVLEQLRLQRLALPRPEQRIAMIRQS